LKPIGAQLFFHMPIITKQGYCSGAASVGDLPLVRLIQHDNK
jgi:hypothetical protein